MSSNVLSSTSTALIVIDVQESFRHRPYYSADGMPIYLAAQNTLIGASKERGIPIVRIFHSEGPKMADNAFAIESGHVRALEGLADFEAEVSFIKSRHSALVGTGLDVWLTQRGITDLIISGIRTEQCCETTTRHASDLGWDVTYALDATLTWPMTQPDGTVLSAHDLRQRTATVLQDRFAQVMSANDVIAKLSA
jgi:nicotinamidase-related amidase